MPCVTATDACPGEPFRRFGPHTEATLLFCENVRITNYGSMIEADRLKRRGDLALFHGIFKHPAREWILTTQVVVSRTIQPNERLPRPFSLEVARQTTETET